MLEEQVWLELYKWMHMSREVDRVEMELIRQGEAFFHVGGAGHEALVSLLPHLQESDWLHCHYRDKSLMLGRGISAEMFIHSVLARDTSHSRGRQMGAFMSGVECNVLSIVGPVGNGALQAAGVAHTIKNQPDNPIVFCGLGDGMTQEGEVLEAIGEAVRSNLPVLFVVEDNGFAISTKTKGQTFYSLPGGMADSFCGVPLVYMDGTNVEECYNAFGETVSKMRETCGPAICIFNVERLASHTNADDQSLYRSEDDIRQSMEKGDPLRKTREAMLAAGISEEKIVELEEVVTREVEEGKERARRAPDPEPCYTAKKPLEDKFFSPDSENRGDSAKDGLTMLGALNRVLRDKLESDERVVIYGEDIEDPKGDVFGATRGLSTDFPGRVKNSPLAESTIVGVSIGRALAGERPIAFMQFGDFLPLAYNQIISELGTLFWRTDGAWQAPVILMIPSGGYKPGLGHFHSQTLESTMAHVSGIDVFVASSATDVAGMVNTAYQSGRPTCIFYPKNLLNDRTDLTAPDVSNRFIPLKSARKLLHGEDITFVAWGNDVKSCMRAANDLESVGITSEVIDLRGISPWDEDMVIASAEKTGHLLVVHEDSHTCGMGAEVLATVAAKSGKKIAMDRITRYDTCVPYQYDCHLEILPGYKRVLEGAAKLLDIDIKWEEPPRDDPGEHTITTIGSSPADESISIIDLMVAEGDEVEAGALIANVEADKASADITTPVGGVVEKVFLSEGDTVKVGVPLVRIRLPEGEIFRKALTEDNPGNPVITVNKSGGEAKTEVSATSAPVSVRKVGLGMVSTKVGSRVVDNSELVTRFPDMDNEGILQRTGIEKRHWLGLGETPVSLAIDVAKKVLSASGLKASDLDLIICSTGSPERCTPSMACMILNELCKQDGAVQVPAFDINAACSGYLYGLKTAWDHLQNSADKRVLLVTTEALSQKVNPLDFQTAFIFGDAATATVLYGEEVIDESLAELSRPTISGEADETGALSVPLRSGDGKYVYMDGTKIFSIAVRRMEAMLRRACKEEGLKPEDLAVIVPHQANQRIINAIKTRVKMPLEKVFSNIRGMGNTSSSSIPLALSEVLPTLKSGDIVGLSAFGGGFTFGAGIMRMR